MSPSGPRVRWLVAGAFLPSSPGPSPARSYALASEPLAQQLAAAVRGLEVTVGDRFGTGDASTYALSLEGLSGFGLVEVVEAVGDLRALRPLLEALHGTRTLSAEETAALGASLGQGRLATAFATAHRTARDVRGAMITLLEEALFSTARDVLHHPRVAPVESAWRGLEWLATQCPPAAGMDVEVLDTGAHRLVESLTEALSRAPLERPDACFLLEEVDEPETLAQLAALAEEASVPVVVSLPSAFLPEQTPASGACAALREAWSALRAEESSRWLGAAINRVVMHAERQGVVERTCFAAPALGVAALLSASFRDTRTFARLVGPGSAIRAPAVWHPGEYTSVATEAALSLHEQERLGARGLLPLSGWKESDAVQLVKAPTVYGGRDVTPLPAQVLIGRLVRLAQEIAERLPATASAEAVSEVCTRAAEAFLPLAPGRSCELLGRVVSLGGGERGLHLRAALRPELVGTRVQLEFTVPLRG